MISEMKSDDFDSIVIRKLEEKFLVEVKTTGDVHYQFKDLETGRLILRTKRSNQRKISPWVLERIKSQLFISKKDFQGLIDCPLSGEDYYKILKKKLII